MTLTPAATQPGRYASIMVPLNLGEGARDLVKLAASLADRLGSRLIGIAGEEFVLPYIGDGLSGVDATLVEDARRVAAENLAKAETAFRGAAGELKDIDWRCTIALPHHFVLSQARAADILVVARQGSDDPGQGQMSLSPGNLVMDLGRPVIVAPPRVSHLAARHIVVAWKDTREARRAVWDALPLLQRAETVTVLSVGAEAEEQGARDVSDYLSLHGVASRAVIRPDSVKYTAIELVDFALGIGSDLIVSGAYGHSRMQEWFFGGVTHDLLESAPVCCLMSH